MRPRTGKRKRKDTIGWSKVLTKQEQQRLICHLKNHAFKLKSKILFLVCDILLNTGLRASELCALRVQDTPYVLGVNFIEVYRGKNDKDRSIPISSRLSKAITRYIKDIRPESLPRYVNKSDTTQFLFYNTQQRCFKRQALYRIVRRVAKRSGITKRVTPHMFRHTYATNVLLKGENIQRLQRLLGHNHLMTTMKYLHFVQDIDAGLGDRIDQGFDDTLWG